MQMATLRTQLNYIFQIARRKTDIRVSLLVAVCRSLFANIHYRKAAARE